MKLKIECDNAAFGDSPAAEIVSILNRFLHSLDNGYIELPYEGHLRDSNGNTVGTVEVK